jgi:hypothetical protein
MRCFIIMWMATLGLSLAAQGIKNSAAVSAELAGPKRAELQVTTTNHIYRSQKYPGLRYSGVAPQAVKSRQPWQLLNPFAPASYGSGQVNTDYEPATGRATGVKLYSLSF